MIGRTVVGVTYTLYKTEEDANSILEKEKRTLDLRKLISEGLSEMSLEQLENIYAYMIST